MTTELNKNHTIASNDLKTCDTSKDTSFQSRPADQEYFRHCSREYYNVNFLHRVGTDLEERNSQRIDIIVNNFEPWQNVDKTKVKHKDISGHGGSKTYEIFTHDEKVQEKYRRLVFHQRNICHIDPLTEERMSEAQKAYFDAGVAVPRYISGKNWYIEPFIEKSGIREIPPLEVAKILAKAHKNTKFGWFEKHRQRAILHRPALKDVNRGSHIWLFTTRMAFYSEFKNHEKFWLNAGFEPLSEAGKKVVCVHGDVHQGNLIYDKNYKIHLIDYEFVSPQWAANDIAYIFTLNSFKCHDYSGKFSFCKKYLEESGFPSDADAVDLLIFDAECQKLRVFWPAMILKEMRETSKNKSYDYKKYRAYEKAEAKIRKDKELIKKAAHKGLINVINNVIEEKGPQLEEEQVKEGWK